MTAPVCNRCNERPRLFDTFDRKRLHHCGCDDGPHCWRHRRDGTWELWFGWPYERWATIPVVDGVAVVPSPDEAFAALEEERRGVTA